jgi:hypothetical protein
MLTLRSVTICFSGSIEAKLVSSLVNSGRRKVVDTIVKGKPTIADFILHSIQAPEVTEEAKLSTPGHPA